MKVLLSALLLLLGQSFVFGQLGNPNRIQRGEAGYVPPTRGIEAREPSKPDADALAIERSDLYAKELGLDAFTKEVVKTYAKEYYSKKLDIQFDPDIKFDEKQQQINELNKVYEKSLSEVLNKDQVDQILMMEQFGNGEKKKKTKKKKKNKKDKS